MATEKGTRKGLQFKALNDFDCEVRMIKQMNLRNFSFFAALSLVTIFTPLGLSSSIHIA